MAKDSAIEWTRHTWNLGWGCNKKSEGCENCYAERDACRFGWDVWGANKPRRLLSRKYYNQPIFWNDAARQLGEKHKVFCGSMMDWTDECWYPMLPFLWQMWRDTPDLIWLMLTKNADAIKDCLPRDWGDGYPNVWQGITTENQKQADIRIPELLKVPAKVRFLSCEPLLELISLKTWLICHACGGTGEGYPSDCPFCYDGSDPQFHWVIAGGESGKNVRPMELDWARSIRDQCQKAGVKFFMKQLGSSHFYGNTKGQHPECWPQDLNVRQFPEVS